MFRTETLTTQIIGELLQSTHKLMSIQQRCHELDVVNDRKVNAQQFKKGLFVGGKLCGGQQLEQIAVVVCLVERGRE